MDLDQLKNHPLENPDINMGRLDESTIHFVSDVMREINEMVSNDQVMPKFYGTDKSEMRRL
jgi:hypothetical protein